MALGSGATGVYSNSGVLWQILQQMGSVTGDRVWRMPLWKHYSSQITGMFPALQTYKWFRYHCKVKGSSYIWVRDQKVSTLMEDS